jgi:predicted nucleotidyltransferase
MLADEGCSEAWLVGSFARGNPFPDSDVDVIARGLTPRTRPVLWWELGRLFGREIDLAEAERIAPERLATPLSQNIRLLP